jgi:hypothetical protein
MQGLDLIDSSFCELEGIRKSNHKIVNNLSFHKVKLGTCVIDYDERGEVKQTIYRQKSIILSINLVTPQTLVWYLTD